ncbi:MAG TPA: rhomboid family intramembrane serine protease [Dongiaceae bacterium]|jgi:membrane associated rhomboid family serine protease|nr:rhomboid family intramembrane serine protease [Dongiaceae bacterium]
MLEDRDYMRQPVYHKPRISFTVALLIINAVVFLVQLISANFPHDQEIQNNYFALSTEGLEHYRIWQLLTFQFMHASWMHLIFNSLAIFFFGRSVETILGRNRFLTLYFSSGIVGGAVQMLFALWRPDFFGGAVVGASAGAYGLVAAFAVINWTERFTLLIYFIPVTMRGKTLLWVSIGLALVGLLTPGSGVANAAHLGGILTGFFCVRYIFGRWPQLGFPSHRSEPGEFAAKSAGRKSFWRSNANTSDEDLSADEFLQKEVDPILEKISAHGIHSLTARERETLEKARAKMAKR